MSAKNYVVRLPRKLKKAMKKAMKKASDGILNIERYNKNGNHVVNVREFTKNEK